MSKAHPPVHQWTHTGDRVLLVKIVNKDMTSYGGFVWPKAGPVTPAKWSRQPDCDSGGLFGWAWGTGLGDGKDPHAGLTWLVFSAKPENVIMVGSGPKVKAVPGEDGSLPEVVYCGTQAGAMKFTHEGRMAWIVGNARSSAASSGDSSSAASSGDSSSAASSGDSSSAASSGDRSSAASSGDRSSAASSGDSSSAASSGYSSSAASSGYSSSAASSGDSSSAASSGDRSSAASSGDRSISAACGEYVTVESTGKGGICVANADRLIWKSHPNAILVVRWKHPKKKEDTFPSIMIDGAKLKGRVVNIQYGKIVKEFTS
jgi:hypothetical protein